MAVGKSPKQVGLVGSSASYCGPRLSETSVYSLLHRESHRLFPDESFADLFDDVGRRSIPPQIVAVVMSLQRMEGLSDREAVDRFTFDLRWKYAAGGLNYDYPGFVHTVLVDMRARLARSERPNRIFDAVLDVCSAAGLVGRKRVFDSTALYDAVATQDTVTLVRSAIRGLLRVASAALRAKILAVLAREDDYAAAGKPACDWGDKSARETLIDALAKDAHAALSYLEDRMLATALTEAATLLATVVGQDIERGDDGRFRIIRGVASDRIISTVDPDARHGHKTKARSFDGYKGHISIDPDSEIIVASEVTAGNVGDGEAARPLLEEAFESEREAKETSVDEVYGDASYGTTNIVEKLESAGIEANVKVQEPVPPKKGFFSKRDFDVDLDEQTVRCPRGILVRIRPSKATRFEGVAAFAKHCTDCSLRERCTISKSGRTMRITRNERTLQRNRIRQRDSSWKAKYRATRPKVERKIAHLMRRRHGGRRARVRGRERVRADFAVLCATENLKRLAVLRVHHDGVTWCR